MPTAYLLTLTQTPTSAFTPKSKLKNLSFFSSPNMMQALIYHLKCGRIYVKFRRQTRPLKHSSHTL